MDLEFDGQTYELSEEITGAKYLELQAVMKKANEKIDKESKEGLRLFAEATKKALDDGVDPPNSEDFNIPQPDLTEYGRQNIIARLVAWSRDEEITEASIMNLPSATYQVLHWEVLDLDGQENKKATDFLVTKLRGFSKVESVSPSEISANSPQAGSEQPVT